MNSELQVDDKQKKKISAGSVKLQVAGNLILARNSDRAQAKVLAAQVCEAIRTHPFDLGNGVVLRKTCSLGFSAFPLLPGDPDKFSWEQAVELADQCLYEAKHGGRDGWVGCLLDDGGSDGAVNGIRRQMPGYGPAWIQTSHMS